METFSLIQSFHVLKHSGLFGSAWNYSRVRFDNSVPFVVSAVDLS